MNTTEQKWHIQVFGPGCGRCKKAYTAIHNTLEELDLHFTEQVQLERIHDIEQMVEAGIMTTPTVMINGSIVLSGGIPSKKQVYSWLGLT